ncbi:hypothetical protein [Duganella phyllosphaerae]|uniref:Uncharacterized protein n=1 Tax=Duganella phyllosphaerae TaxID=762836 RepID=A0A1E7W681_9BURK|nr:hypothetical protein [Duganella phyllosphaerae]OEZ91520.1 hypothetical protein DUPY_51320 [Duganella phyllosphaerae]
MIIAGTLVEVGQIDDQGTLGAVVQRLNGETITITGLTLDETRAVAQRLFLSVMITVAAGAPP